jgi:uncharacterized membrane protein YdjX (TVP38/TMEM64 family)
MNGKWGVMLLLILLVLLALAAFLPLERLLLQLQLRAEEHPVLATAMVGAAFLLAVILLLPVSPIVMLAGFMFGLAKGFLLIWATGFLASSLAFWIGRSSARQWVKRKLESSSVFVAVDRAVGRSGLWVVLLTRLAMVFPFGPLNYSFGLSAVRYRDFLIGTNLGMIPSYLLVVYLGATASGVAAFFNEGLWPGDQSLIIGALALAFALLSVALIARSAFRVLREDLTSPESGGRRSPEV